jgi:hypothetical protein
MSRFPITPVLVNGNWTITLGKPVIKELAPISKRSANRGKQNRFSRQGAEELRFQAYQRFQRIIIIQLTGQVRDDQSISKTHESVNSTDIYTITIKSTNYQESQDIFDNMRAILLDANANAITSHYIIGEMELAPTRGRFAYDVEVQARKAGRVRDTG